MSERRVPLGVKFNTHPNALHAENNEQGAQRSWQFSSYLSATKTDRAFCAFTPKTFLKNSEATVTPDFKICCFVAALRIEGTVSRLQQLQAKKGEAERMTHAKYATFASKYRIAQMPNPRGPAILRVRTGSLTSFIT